MPLQQHRLGSRPAAHRPFAGWAAGFLLATGLLAGSAVGAASGENDPLEALPERVSAGELQGSLPQVDLGLLRSLPGEAKLDFLKRVGSVLDTYTGQTGFEACGMIAQNAQANAWAIRMTSNQAHIGCAANPVYPWAFYGTGESIHTHPRARSYRVNASDQTFRGYQHRLHSKQGTNPEHFSDIDLESASGYGVFFGRLLYHSRQGVVDHGMVNPPMMAGQPGPLAPVIERAGDRPPPRRSP